MIVVLSHAKSEHREELVISYFEKYGCLPKGLGSDGLKEIILLYGGLAHEDHEVLSEELWTLATQEANSFMNYMDLYSASGRRNNDEVERLFSAAMSFIGTACEREVFVVISRFTGWRGYKVTDQTVRHLGDLLNCEPCQLKQAGEESGAPSCLKEVVQDEELPAAIRELAQRKLDELKESKSQVQKAISALYKSDDFVSFAGSKRKKKRFLGVARDLFNRLLVELEESGTYQDYHDMAYAMANVSCHTNMEFDATLRFRILTELAQRAETPEQWIEVLDFSSPKSFCKGDPTVHQRALNKLTEMMHSEDEVA